MEERSWILAVVSNLPFAVIPNHIAGMKDDVTYPSSM